MPFVPDREELAWAAGFFDGEGSIHIHNRKARRLIPNVSITQAGTHPTELLERFRRAVGGLGTVCGPYQSKNGTWKARWQFEVVGFEKCQAVMAMLWRFLGPVKRAKAKKVLLAHLNNSPA